MLDIVLIVLLVTVAVIGKPSRSAAKKTVDYSTTAVPAAS